MKKKGSVTSAGRWTTKVVERSALKQPKKQAKNRNERYNVYSEIIIIIAEESHGAKIKAESMGRASWPEVELQENLTKSKLFLYLR